MRGCFIHDWPIYHARITEVENVRPAPGLGGLLWKAATCLVRRLTHARRHPRRSGVSHTAWGVRDMVRGSVEVKRMRGGGCLRLQSTEFEKSMKI